MPEIFRQYGFVFFFFSREHDPIHVNVKGNGGFAKFALMDDTFVLVKSEGIKKTDLKNIEEAIEINKALIIRKWHDKFY